MGLQSEPAVCLCHLCQPELILCPSHFFQPGCLANGRETGRAGAQATAPPHDGVSGSVVPFLQIPLACSLTRRPAQHTAPEYSQHSEGPGQMGLHWREAGGLCRHPFFSIQCSPHGTVRTTSHPGTPAVTQPSSEVAVLLMDCLGEV